MDIFQRLSLQQKQNEANIRSQKNSLLTLRVIAILVLAAVLCMHIRSLRVFRWEQSVSGGVLVTYLIAVIGLALCAGVNSCEDSAFRAYLCSTGSALLLVNAGAIWHRWKGSSQATQAIAEILYLLGMPLKRQVLLKVILCSVAAVIFMLDLALVPIFTAINEY